ncbi:hypothetical protein CR513_28481, partial [Mucuna pruriens]
MDTICRWVFQQQRDHPGGPEGGGSRTVPLFWALLAGIWLAKELGARMLTVKSDSQLVIRKVNSKYQAKDLQLTKYLNLNERADLLAKLASTQKGGLYRTVIKEALGRPTIEEARYHTTPHSTTQETPFRLTFGTDAMIPIEVEELLPRPVFTQGEGNEEELRENLDFL